MTHRNSLLSQRVEVLLRQLWVRRSGMWSPLPLKRDYTRRQERKGVNGKTDGGLNC